MSRAIQNPNHHPHPYEQWGPDHQYMQAPWHPEEKHRHPVLRFFGWFLAAMYLHTLIDNGGRDEIGWCLNVLFFGWIAKKLIQGVRNGTIPVHWIAPLARRVAYRTASRTAVVFARVAPLGLVERVLGDSTQNTYDSNDSSSSSDSGWQPTIVSPADEARWKVECYGGGAYLGESQSGEMVCADAESAVMVLGPPRSGKTSGVMIPAVLGAPGAVIGTSTKPDVMRATWKARAEIGQVWLFDPAGNEDEQLPDGVERLRWSPVAAAKSWDGALVMARAMTACASPGKGTTNETHWAERAGALLAPLLYAANLTGRPIEDVLHWTLRQDMTEALEILGKQHKHTTAANVLIGIERTDTRERSSIYSATAGVLAAYNADATRASASEPNFDPEQFAKGTDTIYITAPEQKQALCAPLIVGLLEQVRHAVYERARQQDRFARSRHKMLWALDEVANIAPIHDLPALVSQAGGQNLQVMIGLQDLSQARTRWGQEAAEGFMSLFQTRMVLHGIGDAKTLESISVALGEYDREVYSASTGRSDNEYPFAPDNRSEGVSYHTQSRRVLTPGEVASVPEKHALLLEGAGWELIGLTPWRVHNTGATATREHGA